MRIDSYKLEYKTLKFKFEAGTSRGILKTHDVIFLILKSGNNIGIGEIAPLAKLSIDFNADFDSVISNIDFSLLYFNSQEEIFEGIKQLNLVQYPSLVFALETAFLDLINNGKKEIFKTDFYNNSQTIPINGLIWMNTKEHMTNQVETKLKQGFTCIKMKIGALNLEHELEVLQHIRSKFTKEELVLRVDANGAFDYKTATNVLEKLSELGIHSIEQPLPVNNPKEMRLLAKFNNVGVALDEELIGAHHTKHKIKIIETFEPDHLILKPTLLGGMYSCLEWIKLANKYGINWWLTSALESNIGLNAICQFASYLDVKNYQGLGTGQLYHNNITSPLTIETGNIFYDKNVNWGNLNTNIYSKN